MNFGTPETPQKEAFAQLDAFIEAGGNLIDTADVHKAVLWLCSPAASLVTGVALPVDGGFTAH
jgi:NAD(P)-dependent dehydrogenase (short-subunit alcohol dehydrogenase family)